MGFQQDDRSQVSSRIRGLGDMHKTSAVNIKRMVRSNLKNPCYEKTVRKSHISIYLSMITTKEVVERVSC